MEPITLIIAGIITSAIGGAETFRYARRRAEIREKLGEENRLFEIAKLDQQNSQQQGRDRENRLFEIAKLDRQERLENRKLVVSSVVTLVGLVPSILIFFKPPQPPQSAVSFNINDNLGTSQVSEQITMMIDGKMVGTLTVNQNYPKAFLTVTVPNPGMYTFKADARAVFNDGVERICSGEGKVSVSDGKSFSVVADLVNNSCSLALR